MKRRYETLTALAAFLVVSGQAFAADDSAVLKYEGTVDEACDLSPDTTEPAITFGDTDDTGTEVDSAEEVIIGLFCNEDFTLSIDDTFFVSLGGAVPAPSAPPGFATSFGGSVSTSFSGGIVEGSQGPKVGDITINLGAPVGSSTDDPLVAGDYSGTVTVVMDVAGV